MRHKLYKYLSRPEVGSSRKMIAGRVTNSTPMEVRFRSPPEMPADRLLLQRTQYQYLFQKKEEREEEKIVEGKDQPEHVREAKRKKSHNAEP